MEKTGGEESGQEGERGGPPPRAQAMLRGIEAAKRHPVVVVTPDYVDRVLGSPDSVLDPAADCEGCEALSLRIYALGKELTVRALFEGSTLGMFLVTRVNPEVKPQIRWQKSARGELGDVSFAEASALDGEGTITPTDVAFWPGVQRITYMEVFALGAPGNYEGLILGHSTEEPPAHRCLHPGRRQLRLSLAPQRRDSRASIHCPSGYRGVRATPRSGAWRS